MQTWMVTVIMTLVCCGLGLSLLAFLLVSWLEDQVGFQASRELLSYGLLRAGLVGLVLTGLLTALSLTLPPSWWRPVTWGLCLLGLLALWGLVALWMQQRRRQGEVLLTVAGVQTLYSRAVTVLLVVLGLALLAAGLWWHDPVWILQSVYLLSFAGIEAMLSRGGVQVTTNGLYGPLAAVRWPQVRRCRWTEGTDRFAVLVVETGGWFWGRQVFRAEWGVYEAVDDLLRRFLDASCQPPVRSPASSGPSHPARPIRDESSPADGD